MSRHILKQDTEHISVLQTIHIQASTVLDRLVASNDHRLSPT